MYDTRQFDNEDEYLLIEQESLSYKNRDSKEIFKGIGYSFFKFVILYRKNQRAVLEFKRFFSQENYIANRACVIRTNLGIDFFFFTQMRLIK